MVIVGNLPFIDDIVGYVTSGLYWKSVAAATLINILILVTFEFSYKQVSAGGYSMKTPYYSIGNLKVRSLLSTKNGRG